MADQSSKQDFGAIGIAFGVVAVSTIVMIGIGAAFGLVHVPPSVGAWFTRNVWIAQAINAVALPLVVIILAIQGRRK